MDDIYNKIEEIRKNKIPAALVTIIETSGSTPRDVGAKMLVLGDGTIHGTIGGSSVESMVIEDARNCIKTGKYKKVHHSLNDLEKHDTGMICGGKMEFFIEPINLAPHIYIFGGGHCGYPLARFSIQLGFQYTVIEDRPEFAKDERFPQASEILLGDVEAISQKIDIGLSDYVAIVTRNHELDFRALRNIIKKPAKYIGLIGSKRKRQQIFKRLLNEGINQTEIDRIHTPIGLDINAETPEEIAISILAEIIKIKNS